jgi:hypothetical protein
MIQLNAPSSDGAFLVVRNGRTAFWVRDGGGFQGLNPIFWKKKNGLSIVNKGVTGEVSKKSSFNVERSCGN